MPLESVEERTVEVLLLPDGVSEELLYLYFENKRRSGGGPLISVERKEDQAILLFEDAEAAARVLCKDHHVLHNVELSVRRPASKDQHRLLLQCINPNTMSEMIELYVENMMSLNVNEYHLQYSPGRNSVLIHLNQPLSKDFQTLSAEISRRALDGAVVSLVQVEQSDSVLVERFHPDTTEDLLLLYFESKRGGSHRVKEVTKLSEGTAKVSFVDHKSLGRVLDQRHQLEGAELAVKPFYDFLQSIETSASLQNSARGSRDMTNSEDLSDVQMTNADSQMASQDFDTQTSKEEAAEEAMEDQPTIEVLLSNHIPIAEPAHLALFERSPLLQDMQKIYQDFTIAVKDSVVLIEGPDGGKMEQIKQTIVDFLGNMTTSYFTLEAEKLEFLARNDVKEQLLKMLSQSVPHSFYSVCDSKVVVTSLSQKSAEQAFHFLKSQICHFSMKMNAGYECIFCCREWSEFVRALEFSSVKLLETNGNIDVLTLSGMENEKQAAILLFLSTPIERETVIPMELGILKYIQNHHHQLLADMEQVSIFPLEADDVCGFKIHGPAVACQMAEEVLRGIVSSMCIRNTPVCAPGVARFLLEDQCKTLMNVMETKFQVYISITATAWEYLPYQDIFEYAWELMAHRNFCRVSVHAPAEDSQSDPMQTDQNGVPHKGLLEQAKKLLSAIDGGVVQKPDTTGALEDEDLYTADEPSSLHVHNADEVFASDGSQTSAVRDSVSGSALVPPISKEEEAHLSLALQYSMESSHWSQEDEDEQLKKALELSMMQHEASSGEAEKSPQAQMEWQDVNVALEETIKAANKIELRVFAGYASDLNRVDIAFGKRVSQRQAEEKLEHKAVGLMSEYHMKCLEVIKRRHAVEIQIQGTIITISGFQEFLYGGAEDTKRLLEKLNNSVSEHEILRTVQWVTHDPASSDTTPYSPEAIVFIEQAWRSRRKTLKILLDNQPHVINFEKMKECNTVSHKSVKVTRKLLQMGDLLEEIPEQEVSLLSNLPEASKVDEDSDEFQNVVKHFYETIQESHSKIRIIQVQKLTNRLLYNQYKLKKLSIMQRTTNPDVERTLYHGTSETSMREICVHGFNRSFCGKNATTYGQGVYFAVNSGLSVQDLYSPPNKDGYKFIIVSKVLTGDYTKGYHELKTAPLKATEDVPLRYDSVTDCVNKPSMFVIFNDTQAYPEYLITCQRMQRR